MAEQRRNSSTDEQAMIFGMLAEILADQMNGQLEAVALNEK